MNSLAEYIPVCSRAISLVIFTLGCGSPSTAGDVIVNVAILSSPLPPDKPTRSGQSSDTVMHSLPKEALLQQAAAVRAISGLPVVRALPASGPSNMRIGDRPFNPTLQNDPVTEPLLDTRTVHTVVITGSR